MSLNRKLLDAYLIDLRLHTFAENYDSFAQDATQNKQSHQEYLFALVRQEASERDRKREQQRIRAAKFPAIKELSDFDFSALPSLNPQRILDLSWGNYIHKKQSIILVGNPGLGKTHISISLALAACRQFHRVRFYRRR